MKNPRITNESDAAGADYMHGLAIDAVIFGFHDQQLKVLLMQYKKSDIFALPGGFIHKSENLNEAAQRVVSERTGLLNIYLDQFYVFGDISRFDPRPLKSVMRAMGGNPDDTHWLLQRFISVGYYALVDFTKVTPMPDRIFDVRLPVRTLDIPRLMQTTHRSLAKDTLKG